MTSFIPPGDDSEMPDDCNPYVEQDQEYDRKEPSRDRPLSTGGPHTSTSDARTDQARQSEAATSAPAKPVTTINSSGSAVTLTQEGKLIVRVADQQQIERQVDHLRGELAKKEQEVQYWQQKYKRERDMKHLEIRDIQRQLDSALGREAAQAEHTKELLALLETRRRELHDAQRFMGTVDAFSEGDVVQHVRDLNAEIFSLAQSLSGTQAKASHLNDRTKGKAAEALASALGRPLLEMLTFVDTHGDTVLLEVSTQVIATNILSWMISTWTNDPESDQLFASVYERIQNSESQSVAGQWRALTRKSAQAEYIGGPQLEDHCTERLVTLLTHAAALSGIHISEYPTRSTWRPYASWPKKR
ncbi:hypothetical protein FOMPIDRAFT_1049489 [Fomitopsis schrenkii]|uniref:Uncharacterized protein n=1 Tax=Fomitopsis schrenkii TaxID=2126942 RepID=S8E7Y0_FOMSC|nr:hypothetical protein FOMPIDRAFT_1049489 [Fomitopsis schrenkii]